MNKSEDQLIQEAMLKEMASDGQVPEATPLDSKPEVEEAEVVDQSTEAEGSAEETTEAATEDEPAAEEAVEEAEEEPSFAGYKKSEIDAAFQKLDRLQRALDNTNGTYGNKLQKQQEVIAELQRQLEETKSQSTKRAVNFKGLKFEKLQSEFPELAELLIADLEGAQDVSPIPEQDEPAAKTAVPDIEERLSKFEEQLALKQAMAELSAAHPDWKETAGFNVNDTGVIQWNDMRFGNWVATLPHDAQKEVLNAADATVISGYLTQYKETIAKPKKATSNSNKANLDATVLPITKASTGKRVLNEEEEMMEAFRREMMSLN